MVLGRHALRRELSKVGPRSPRGLCDQERKAEPRVTGQGERDPLPPPGAAARTAGRAFLV